MILNAHKGNTYPYGHYQNTQLLPKFGFIIGRGTTKKSCNRKGCRAFSFCPVPAFLPDGEIHHFCFVITDENCGNRGDFPICEMLQSKKLQK